MPEAEILNQYEGKSLDETKAAVKTLHDSIQSVFKAHTDDKGNVSLETVKGEDAETIKEANLKLSDAHTHLEGLLALSAAKTQGEHIERLLRDPAAGQLVQPQKGLIFPRQQFPSLGAAFVQSDEFKSYKESGQKNREWSADAYYYDGEKTVLGTDDTLVDVTYEYAPETRRVGTVVDVQYQRNNVAPLIPSIQTTQHAIAYMQENVIDPGAAETAEGALSPEALIEWTEVLATIKKISVAHALTEELAADEPSIRGIVNGRLRTFMNNREDLQLLRGDGTGDNLLGLVNTPGIGSVTWSVGTGTAQTFLEAIFSATTKVAQNFHNAGQVVMNAGSWEYIRLAKDGNLNYLIPPGAEGMAVNRVWGMPVTLNENMDDRLTATNVPVLVGDFAMGATTFRRQDIQVAFTDSHADEFMRGIFRVRLTSRVGLVVWRAGAFTTVDVVV